MASVVLKNGGNNMSLNFNIFALLFALSMPLSLLKAAVASPAEGNAIYKLEGLVSLFVAEHNRLPDSWQDMFQYDPELSMLDGYFKGSDNLGDLYSFIPAAERTKFWDGQILLIRSKPMSWPEIWKDPLLDIDLATLPAEKKAELASIQAHQGSIRYLIYRDKAGHLKTEWWHEHKVQSMVAETGIVIPPPTPYKLPVPVVSASENTTKVAPSASPAKTPLPVSSVPTASNYIQWIIAAVITLAAILFIARLRK